MSNVSKQLYVIQYLANVNCYINMSISKNWVWNGGPAKRIILSYILNLRDKSIPVAICGATAFKCLAVVK